MVTTFVDDDDGYLRWIALNRRGFVVNTPRSPSASYLMLHSAGCKTVNGVPARGENWTLDYIKVCAVERFELDRWARDEVGGALTECQFCL